MNATLFIPLTVVVCLVHACQAKPSVWTGSYEYEASYGETVGGSPIVLNYTINITQVNNELSAVMEVSGFQTNESILCDVNENENKVTLVFRGYRNGDVDSAFGLAVYKPRQPLLALENTERDGENILVTHWLGLAGLDGRTLTPGTHFRKSGPANRRSE